MSFLGFESSDDRETRWLALRKPVPPGKLAELSRFSAAVNQLSGAEFVVKHATRCFAVTKSRVVDGADLRLMISVFAEELAIFPPDLVATAFRDWARQEKWWPSLSEILEPCEAQMKWRRSLAEICRAA